MVRMMMPVETKKDAMATLLGEIQNHAGDRSLVPGEGNLDAGMVIVGEAPGRQEEEQARPFVGRSGQLLDEMLQEIGLERKDIWLTNLVKWRPTKRNPSHSTRPPSINELKLFTPWLWTELRIIQPSVVVCLGRAAAQAVIDRELHIDADHGRIYPLDGFSAMATYHPAYVLRFGGRKDDYTWRLVIDDLKRVAEYYRAAGQANR